MLKNNIRKVILSVIAIFLVIGVAYTTYATDSSILDEILKETNENISGNENVEEIPEGVNNNVSSNANTNTNANTAKVNENLPETTPYTGIGDYSGLIFVVIFGISAIYAYKKVKEYNA